MDGSIMFSRLHRGRWVARRALRHKGSISPWSRTCARDRAGTQPRSLLRDPCVMAAFIMHGMRGLSLYVFQFTHPYKCISLCPMSSYVLSSTYESRVCVCACDAGRPTLKVKGACGRHVRERVLESPIQIEWRIHFKVKRENRKSLIGNFKVEINAG